MARKDSGGGLLLVPWSLLLMLLLLCATHCEARGISMRLQSRSSNPLLNALYKLNFIRKVEPARPLQSPPAAGTDAESLAAGDTNAPFCVNPPDAPPASTMAPPFTSTPFTPSVPDQAPPLPPITPVPPSFEPSPPESGAPGSGGQGGQEGQGGGQGQGGQGGGQGQGGQGGGQGGDQGQGGQGGGQGQGGQGGGQGQEGPPASTTPSTPPQTGPGAPFGSAPPSPIVLVPSPPEFGPGGGGGPGSGGGGGGGGGSGGGGPFQPPIIYPPPLAPPLPPGAGQTLWCVAKPTVPDPIIQEAMDYACGSGAECDSITPSGACYHPNTVLAHASFAFNSYWQQSKATGGTCDFGGTATIVTRDPSYEKCKFDLL